MSNQLQRCRKLDVCNDQSIVLEGGDFVRNMDELSSMLVNVIDGMPVYLQDVADS